MTHLVIQKFAFLRSEYGAEFWTRSHQLEICTVMDMPNHIHPLWWAKSDPDTLLTLVKNRLRLFHLAFFMMFFACFFSLCGSFLMGVIFPFWLACFLHVSDVIDCMIFYHMNYCFVLQFFT